MIQAIRIEHPDGCGLFVEKTDKGIRRKWNVYVLPELVDRHKTFHNLWTDFTFGDGEMKKHFCAFKTMDQLKEWVFHEEIQVLIKNDFKVYLLELSEAKVSEFQIAYMKENITLKKDITNLFL